MATNKRKEAAALFELIDKSTLKVPKAGGNLKIPGWWSNKTNPTNKQVPTRSVAAPNGAASAGGGVAVAEAPEAMPDKESAVGAEPQKRLFEPPPAHVTPSVSPSIRPPKAPPAASATDPVPATSSEAGAPAASGAGSPAKSFPGAAGAASRTADGPRPSRGAGAAGGSPASGATANPVLVPPTMAPGRRTWVPPRPARLTSVPWRAVGGVTAAVVLMIVVGVVLMIRSHGKKAAPVPEAGTVERLFDGGSVPRSRDLYYVVVYTTPAGNLKPADSSAFKQAKYLAEHGVEVSIERVEQPVRGAGNRTESWYWVVSAKGFGSATEAKPFRDQIVKIGDQLSPGVWKEAYARNGLSTPGGSAAAR